MYISVGTRPIKDTNTKVATRIFWKRFIPTKHLASKQSKLTSASMSDHKATPGTQHTRSANFKYSKRDPLNDPAKVGLRWR